jgi:hypothetical protein
MRFQDMKTCASIFERLSTAAMIGYIGWVCLFGSGCASRNVNPPVPRPHTGYVDFYTGSAEDLNWDVKCSDPASQASRTVYSELEYLDDNILRLAFAPGHYTFSVGFLNRIILERAKVEVDVSNGMVTPVRVSLDEAGTAIVKSKDVRAGGTYYGRYGRSTRIRSEDDPVYRVLAEAHAPLPYATKGEAPYYATAPGAQPGAR